MSLQHRAQAKEVRGILDDILKLPVPQDKCLEFGIPQDMWPGLTYAKAIAMKLIERGCLGESAAIKELFDRLYGKPVQTNENINANMSFYDFAIQIIREEEKEFPTEEPKKTIELKRQKTNHPRRLPPAAIEASTPGPVAPASGGGGQQEPAEPDLLSDLYE